MSFGYPPHEIFPVQIIFCMGKVLKLGGPQTPFWREIASEKQFSPHDRGEKAVLDLLEDSTQVIGLEDVNRDSFSLSPAKKRMGTL
jgi:hypothetical protein